MHSWISLIAANFVSHSLEWPATLWTGQITARQLAIAIFIGFICCIWPMPPFILAATRSYVFVWSFNGSDFCNCCWFVCLLFGFFVVVVIVVAALTAGHFSSAEAKTSTQFGHFRFCYLISRKFIFNCHRKFCINNLADCRVSVM